MPVHVHGQLILGAIIESDFNLAGLRLCCNAQAQDTNNE
jgi:hypothetical protein